MNYKEEIRKVLSENKKDGLHVSEITEKIIAANNNLFADKEIQDKGQLQTKINGILHADVIKKIGCEFSKVINPKTKKPKKGWYKLRKTEQIIKQIDPPEPIEKPGDIIIVPDRDKRLTSFIGKAGECAVMSELLFRGYNANLMMVDDGVDIVANKKNMYYFIQVKTTVLDNNKIQVTIKKGNCLPVFIR